MKTKEYEISDNSFIELYEELLATREPSFLVPFCKDGITDVDGVYIRPCYSISFTTALKGTKEHTEKEVYYFASANLMREAKQIMEKILENHGGFSLFSIEGNWFIEENGVKIPLTDYPF
jgi:hypothetical protein